MLQLVPVLSESTGRSAKQQKTKISILAHNDFFKLFHESRKKLEDEPLRFIFRAIDVFDAMNDYPAEEGWEICVEHALSEEVHPLKSEVQEFDLSLIFEADNIEENFQAMKITFPKNALISELVNDLAQRFGLEPSEVILSAIFNLMNLLEDYDENWHLWAINSHTGDRVPIQI